MANAHRRFFGTEALQLVLRRSGIDSPLAGQALLAGGTFNSVYRLTFADRPAVVLKLSPDPAGPVLTYERQIVAAEAEFYTLAGERAGLPVPKIVSLQELGPDLGGGQALLVTELPG